MLVKTLSNVTVVSSVTGPNLFRLDTLNATLALPECLLILAGPPASPFSPFSPLATGP